MSAARLAQRSNPTSCHAWRELEARAHHPAEQLTQLELRKAETRAHILDGRVPHALLLEFFTREGIGTMIDATTPMTPTTTSAP